MDNEKKPVAVGPMGGSSGSKWDDGVYTSVRQIVIIHGAGIDSIQFEYDKQGYPVWSNKHGGAGGFKTDKVKLDYPKEFLTSIHGYYGALYERGPICVRSLTFVSNDHTYGPFGVQQGTFFSIPKGTDKVVGFFGRCGWFLDAIGAYLMPVNQINTSSSVIYEQQSYVVGQTESNGYSVIRGSLGQDYDIVLAIKQRENFSNTQPMQKVRADYNKANRPNPITFSTPQSSHSDSDSDSSDGDKKQKVMALPPHTKKKPFDIKEPVTHENWGGGGGSPFDDGKHTGIKQINISRNIGIVYIKVLYDQNGQDVWGRRNGGTGGFKTDKVLFDYPYEILTHITGFYGPTMISTTIIKSLTFHTTKGKHGPFGDEQGIPFSTKREEGMVVGFHGRKGLFLDAIGVHVKEGKVTPQVRPPSALHADAKPITTHEDPLGPSKQIVAKGPFHAPIHDDVKPVSTHGDPLWPSKQIVAQGPSHTHLHDEAKPITTHADPFWPSKQIVAKGPSQEPYKVVKEPAPCGAGPWGGDGGKQWDDGVFTGIKQIFLTRTEAICSIQIEYDRNGQSVWSVKHGGNSGATTHLIKLEYPHEVLTCISGYYGPIKDDHSKVIKALTFYTSRGKYGPYGEEIGTFFTSTTTEGKVVGFHGRSSLYLDAIGTHMQHWLGSYKQPKSTFFKMFG